MKKWCIVLLIILTSSAWAEVTTRLESAQVTQGQSFRITFSYEGSASGIVPDLSPLEQQFSILGTSKSSQVSIINGTINSITQWTVTLMAEQVGEFNIPALQFGQENSQAVKVQVLSGNEPRHQAQSKDAFLVTSVDNQHPYVQAQIIYSVKLYYANSLVQADFQEPSAKDVIIERLGKAKTYQAQQNGKLYQVIEQQYALFPQKSGEITIDSPVFKGALRRVDINRIDDLLNNYQQPVQLHGENIQLNVRPIPSDYSGTWLPAKALSLDEQWQGLSQEVKAGEPITRTITLTATGLTAEQIPRIEFQDKEGLKIYPEKATRHNSLGIRDVLGTKTVKIVYIPTKNGELSLPSIKINWWDTQNLTQKTSILAKRVIKVHGAHPTSAPPNPSPKVQTVTQKPQAITSSSDKRAWWLAGLLATAWLATSLFWYFSRKKPGSVIAVTPQANKDIKKQLKQACMNNQARAAREALLAWASLKWPEQKYHNLASIAEKVNDESFNQALAALQVELYANQSGQWLGEPLWHAWLAIKTHKHSTKTAHALPPMNP